MYGLEESSTFVDKYLYTYSLGTIESLFMDEWRNAIRIPTRIGINYVLCGKQLTL